MGSTPKVQNYIKYLQIFCWLLLAQIHHKHKRLILQRQFVFYIITQYSISEKVQASILSISTRCCRMKQMFIWMKHLYQHLQPSLVWCFSLCTFGFGDFLMFSADPFQLCQLWWDHVHMWRHFWIGLIWIRFLADPQVDIHISEHSCLLDIPNCLSCCLYCVLTVLPEGDLWFPSLLDHNFIPYFALITCLVNTDQCLSPSC